MHEETHTKSEKPDEDMKRNSEENYPPAKARPKTPDGPHPPNGPPTSKAILDAYWNQYGPKGPDENMQDTPYERMQGPEDWKEPDLLCKEPDGVWKEPDEHCQDPDNHWNSDELLKKCSNPQSFRQRFGIMLLLEVLQQVMHQLRHDNTHTHTHTHTHTLVLT